MIFAGRGSEWPRVRQLEIYDFYQQAQTNSSFKQHVICFLILFIVLVFLLLEIYDLYQQAPPEEAAYVV